MKFITLTQIKERQGEYDEDTGEYAQSHESFPTTINVATIRCFYPRHENRPGTRITFSDGGGFVVSEAYDVVLAQVGAAQAQVLSLAATN